MIVPDNQLSLAIGKKGQNARLAAKLTGMRIDIKSESEVETERADAEESRAALDEPRRRPLEVAQALEEAGLKSPRAIVDVGPRGAGRAARGRRSGRQDLRRRREAWVAATPPSRPEPEPAAEPTAEVPAVDGERPPADA